MTRLGSGLANAVTISTVPVPAATTWSSISAANPVSRR